MTYRSLLVHLDDSPRCAIRVDLAVALARRFDAHLVGLATAGQLPYLTEAGGALASPGLEAIARAMESLRELAAQRAETFRARCTDAGLRSVEAVVDEQDDAASLVYHSHCSDLVILGQADPAGSGHLAARAMVERVVLANARPTLIVPFAGEVDEAQMMRRALIAWNDSRESARALADALPLLTRVDEVHLMQIDGPAEDGTAPTRLAAVRQWLAWHGVDAQLHQERSEVDVGNTLLSRAADLDAGLVVMGAYGHSRWSERMLGGASRTLLSTMTVPVLMSH